MLSYIQQYGTTIPKEIQQYNVNTINTAMENMDTIQQKCKKKKTHTKAVKSKSSFKPGYFLA